MIECALDVNADSIPVDQVREIGNWYNPHVALYTLGNMVTCIGALPWCQEVSRRLMQANSETHRFKWIGEQTLENGVRRWQWLWDERS